MSKPTNLIGQRFGKLTVVGRSANTSGGKARWICECDCGNKKEKPVTTCDLRAGKVRSCGCVYKITNKQNSKTHGLTESRIYTIWSGMKERCKRNQRYKNISVCAEWHDFMNFYNWAVCNGYRDDLTIDRIDNKGGYCPENCRWATRKDQANNRCKTLFIQYNCAEYTASELSEISGIRRATIVWRYKNGWSEKDLLMDVNLANRVIRRKDA